MIKNIAWDTKDKKISAVIFTMIFSSLLFFETMMANYSGIIDVLLVAAAAILFSLFFITSIEGKWNRIFSAQGITAVLTVVVTLGMAITQKTTSTKEGFYTLLVASLLLFMAQNFYLLPVSAVIGAVLSAFVTKPEIQTVAMSCIPGIIGVSFISFSEKLKDSAVVKKIIFAVSQVVMFAAYGYTVYCRRFMISFHSLITEVWDSVALLVAVVIFVLFAVYALKKKAIIEFIGHIVVAVAGIVPMFMEMKYAFFSAMVIYMYMLYVTKEGSVADDVFADTLKLLDPKKRKVKIKKRKI